MRAVSCPGACCDEASAVGRPFALISAGSDPRGGRRRRAGTPSALPSWLLAPRAGGYSLRLARRIRAGGRRHAAASGRHAAGPAGGAAPRQAAAGRQALAAVAANAVGGSNLRLPPCKARPPPGACPPHLPCRTACRARQVGRRPAGGGLPAAGPQPCGHADYPGSVSLQWCPGVLCFLRAQSGARPLQPACKEGRPAVWRRDRWAGRRQRYAGAAMG